MSDQGLDSATRFSVPTIANGYVFVGPRDFDIFRLTTADL